MAEKKDGDEKVTLESVFKDLGDSLDEVINASDDDGTGDDGTGDGNNGDGDGDGGSGDEDGDGAGDGDEQPEVITKAEAARRMKAFEKLVGKVEALGKVLTDPEGDFNKAMTELVETVTAHGKVFEKVLDRLETLESGTATKKSIEGDDSDGEGDKQTPEEKAAVGLNKAVTHMALHPAGAPSISTPEAEDEAD